jgi:hypothetical protein
MSLASQFEANVARVGFEDDLRFALTPPPGGVVSKFIDPAPLDVLAVRGELHHC